MKILIIGQYFEPEGAAGANRMRRFVEALKKHHQVQIITGMPCYPTGKLTKKYRNKMYVRERRQGVEVLRTYEYATANEGGFLRTLNYITFLLSSIIGSFWAGPADIIIATSPPLTVALAGYIIAKFKGAKFVFDVRDLWPESIYELGYMKKESPIYHRLKNLAEYLYGKSHIILCATPGIKRKLSRWNYSKKLSTLVNTVDTKIFKPSRKKVKKGQFTISYIGNFSKAYDFDAFIILARRLPKIRFLLVGEGEEKKDFLKKININEINNIDVKSQVERSQVPKLINGSDIGLIPNKKTYLSASTIPSKVFEYLACATPVVIGGEGDIAKIVSGCSVICSPGDYNCMEKKIISLSKDRRLRADLGRVAREKMMREYSDTIFKKYLLSIINSL